MIPHDHRASISRVILPSLPPGTEQRFTFPENLCSVLLSSISDKFTKENTLLEDIMHDAILKAVATRQSVTIEVAGHDLPFSTHWGASSTHITVSPMLSGGDRALIGVLVFGLNPRRIVDDNYTSFLSQISAQVSSFPLFCLSM